MNTQNSAPMTGAELETMRRAIGWTVGELADRFNVADRSAKYWERGRGGVPDDVAALVLAEYARTLATAQAIVMAASTVEVRRLLVPIVTNAPDSWPNMAAAAKMASAWLQMRDPGRRIESARIDAHQAAAITGQFDASRAAEAVARQHASQAQAHKNAAASA